MALSNETQKFLDSQIEYYVKEAESYKEMALEYNLDADSVPNTAFGYNSWLYLLKLYSNIHKSR